MAAAAASTFTAAATHQVFPVLPAGSGVVHHVGASACEADPNELARKARLKESVRKLVEQNKANRDGATGEDRIAEKKAATRNTKDYTRNLQVGDAMEGIARAATSNSGKIADMATYSQSLRSNQIVILDAVASLSAQINRSENSQRTEMQKIRNQFHHEVDDLKSELQSRFDTIDQSSLSTNQMLAQMMTMMKTTAPAPAPAPITFPLRPIPAQQQTQLQQTQHVPYAPAPPLQASTSPASTLSASPSPASLFPASIVAPVIVASTVKVTTPKDNFKPTPRDKSTQNVFDFAKQFDKTTKDKSLRRIEDALMNLESNDAEFPNLLHTHTATGASAHLGTPEEWHLYLRCCNLKSSCQKSNSERTKIDFYIFQQEPRNWVKQLWEHLQNVRAQDAGHTDK
jgi:hypothetical protein